jgi:soluble lytic murein transglycosylase-like protein
MAAPAKARPAAASLLCLALLAAGPGRAAADVGETCREQAAIAEQAAGIPGGLLLAIGKRESGRFDAGAGGVLPWPWSVNREGEGHFFASRQEAAAYVAAAQREGSSSIDVGCFQINLKYHPMAFASLDQAFDPAANAAYAARFLRTLHDREGSWETAVAFYHSASPVLGVPYRDAVLATWHGIAAAASPFRPASSAAARVVMGIRIFTSGEAYFAPGTIPASATPATPASATPSAPVPPAGHMVRGLPRVITPSGGLAHIRVGG